MSSSNRTENAEEGLDPRIIRSRKMLMDALSRLLKKRSFEDLSIQEIADEATLNRATFYLHYPDKHALLQAFTDARFRKLVSRRGLTFTDCDDALRAIALGVCDYLAENTRGAGQLSRMALEGSIIPVVAGIFIEGAPSHPLAPGTDVALLSTTAAWAIYGAARLWSEAPDRVPAEEMSARIEAMLKPVFKALS